MQSTAEIIRFVRLKEQAGSIIELEDGCKTKKIRL
jgi:hypothetical protein